MNSVFLALGVMVLSLVSSTMAGYVFSRRKFKGKELLYNLFVMFMFINVGSVSLRPLFELAVKVKMNQSLWSVIIISAGTGQATYIFLCRGFMASLPMELDEAAKIDGCTFFQTFRMVIMPLLKPAMATIALLSFRQGWNEYIIPLVFTMTNDKLRPLTVGVNMLKNAGDGTAAWNIMFAGATIAIIPMLLIYCFFSRYFMNGMTAGAVKAVSLRPLFELAVKVKMNQSLWSVIIISAGTGQATYIFLCRGFMASLPMELDEAAKIDGCTFFQTFRMVIMPLLKPAMATIALLSFRQGWNEYIIPLVFTMTNDKLRPLTVGVNMLKNAGDGTAAWNIMFAGATIAIIPMLLIYCFFSRYFMNGMTAGAVKG